MNDLPLTFHLPYPPSVNSLYANRPGIGRVKSERYRTWERAANNMLLAQTRKPFAGNVAVDIQIEKPCDSLPDVITFSPALLTKAIENTVQDELTFDVVVIRRDGELRGGLFRVVEKNDDSVFSVVLIWKI